MLIKYGYAIIRVSTTNQCNVQSGSLEQQKHMIVRWLEEQTRLTGIEYRISKFIVEDKSGKREKHHRRTGFQETLIAIKSRQIDFVVMENVERLGRWQVGNLRLIESARDNNVDVFFLDSGQLNFQDKGSRIAFGLKNLLAEEGSVENQERVTKKQREAMVNNGKDASGYAVLGFDPHTTLACMYMPNDEELKIVTDILQKFVEFQSLTQTVKYICEKKYLTKVKITRQKIDRDGVIIPPRQVGGEVFDCKKLRSLLTCSKYRGCNSFRDSWNQFRSLQDENGIVAWEYWHKRQFGDVIDSDLLDRVDEALKKFQHCKPKAANDGTVTLLTGILKAEDGSKYYRQPGNGNGGNYLYYYNKTTSSRIRADIIEPKVINRIKQYLTESATLEQVVQNFLKNRLLGLPLLDEEIKKVIGKSKELEKVVEGFTDKLRQSATEQGERWKQICECLMDEKGKAQAELTNVHETLDGLRSKRHWINTELRTANLQDCFRKVWEHFDRHDGFQKRQVIQSIIPEAIMHVDGTLELRINADPKGKASHLFQSAAANCHNGHKRLGIKTRWRERPDYEPQVGRT